MAKYSYKTQGTCSGQWPPLLRLNSQHFTKGFPQTALRLLQTFLPYEEQRPLPL